LLADPVRLDAFHRAIRETVKQGDIVADLGSGTGILGLFACRAGAAKVYSIEQGPVIEQAQQIARANHFEDRIVFVQGLSTQVSLPEKVDLILGDLTGQFGWEAGLLDFFPDARTRWLRDSGSLIPFQMDLFVSAVESSSIWNDRIQFWSAIVRDVDLSPLRKLALDTAYPCSLKKEELISQPILAASYNLFNPIPAKLEFSAEMRMDQDATICGIAGWFSTKLTHNIQITNSPLSDHPVKRPQCFLPLRTPLQVSSNDRLEARFLIRQSEGLIQWEVSHKGQQLAQNISALDRSLDETFLLSAMGQALKTVLLLVENGQSLVKIRLEIQNRFADLFPSSRAAEDFVSYVTGRYGKKSL